MKIMDFKHIKSLYLIFFVSLSVEADPQATQIVKSAIDNWRGISSSADMELIIHRANWQRSLRINSWTKGNDHSLVRVTEPRKDAGSATLIIDSQMWSYTPKINRIIKIPSSMMNQSWMGSDFSNKDISREDDILTQYQHRLLNTVEDGMHKVYWIESIPHEDAAVVWGKEILKIRDDHVLISHDFFDQDGEIVKSMTTQEIKTVSGRSVATKQRMIQVDDQQKWTDIIIHHIEFEVEISDNTFTLANLRNPRR